MLEQCIKLIEELVEKYPNVYSIEIHGYSNFTLKYVNGKKERFTKISDLEDNIKENDTR